MVEKILVLDLYEEPLRRWVTLRVAESLTDDFIDVLRDGCKERGITLDVRRQPAPDPGLVEGVEDGNRD